MTHRTIERARATVERIDEKLNGWQTDNLRREIRRGAEVETAGERWRREAGELEDERAAERERNSLTQRTIAALQAENAALRAEVAQGLKAVNGLAKALRDRIGELADDMAALQRGLTAAENRLVQADMLRKVDDARLDDIRKAVHDKANLEDVRFITSPLFDQLESVKRDVSKLNAMAFIDGQRKLPNIA